MTTDEQCMEIALGQAREALAAGEAPVGACLLHDGETVAAHNAVIATLDPSAHAEISVIRAACRNWRTTGLTGARLFVTVEPCPMCQAACHYAGIQQIVFGASLADMQAVTGRELQMPALVPGLVLDGGHRRDASLRLLHSWARRQSG
ncbi:MAG TPA: nucleoside deaminase [Chromatiales bacterium]|nr:nucleoside deaminase [Chromatiales bacterium]